MKMMEEEAVWKGEEAVKLDYWTIGLLDYRSPGFQGKEKGSYGANSK